MQKKNFSGDKNDTILNTICKSARFQYDSLCTAISVKSGTLQKKSFL